MLRNVAYKNAFVIFFGNSLWISWAILNHACTKPDTSEGGYYVPKKDGYNANEKVHYYCYDRSADRIGSETRRCLPDGRWSGTTFRCGCSKPAFPVGVGEFSPFKLFYRIGEIVQYKCSPRKTETYLFGNSSRTCLANGTWSGPLPYCVSRSALQLINYMEGQEVLIDGKANTCLNNDRQSQVFLKLHGKHRQIIVQILSNRNFEKENVYYMANSSSAYNPFTHKFSKPEDGQFFTHYFYNGTKILENIIIGIRVNDCSEANYCRICEVITFTDKISACPSLDKPNSHTITAYDKRSSSSQITFDYGTAAIFSCSDGYLLEGNKIRRCDENNRWTGENTYCRGIKCSFQPPDINNAIWSKWKKGMTYSINDTLEAVCNHGYVNHGESMTVTCVSEETWSPPLIEDNCQAIKCSRQPPELNNGIWSKWKNGMTYSLNDTLEAVCNHGYVNHGESMIVTCASKETWSPQLIEDNCQEIKCSIPPQVIQNGNWSVEGVVESFKLRATLEIICNQGYWKNGTHTNIKCLETGNWSISDVECLAELEPMNMSIRTDIILVAVIGLILVCVCLGVCIFWTRRGIAKRLHKKVKQEDLLLENPIYNSASSERQEEECQAVVLLENPVYNSPSSGQRKKDYQMDNPIYNSTSSDQQEEDYQKTISLENPVYERPSSDHQKDDYQMDNPIYNSTSDQQEQHCQKISLENLVYKRLSSDHKKEDYQMDNPIYNSISSDQQEEGCQETISLENPIYRSASVTQKEKEHNAVQFQTERIVSDLTKHSMPPLTQVPDAETINKLYLTECPIAKPVHEYNSDYEDINVL